MNFIIYDLEATCWSGRPPGMTQETIEIGAVKVNRYGEVGGTFNRFIRPVVHPMLSSFCVELTGIDQPMVNRADEFPEVADDFIDWIGEEDEEYFLCSWGSFDQKMLIRDCNLHRMDSDWVSGYLNLKDQYQRMKKLRHPAGLFKSVEREGFEFEGPPHRAIADAVNLAKIFIKYIDEWVY